MSEQTIVDLGELLDVTLDDIDDLPDNSPFPAGSHYCKASFAQKEINKKPAIELSLELIETVELANPEDTPPKPKDTCSSLYFLDNEYGLGNFKKAASPFATHFGISSLREIVEAVKDIECVVTSSLKSDKTDKTKVYLQIKDIKIA